MNLGLKFEDSLTKRLEAMPTATSFTVRRAALLAGAEPIREATQAAAPRRTGGLAINIIVDALTEHQIERGVDFVGDEAAVQVGPNLPHFYGYFSEVGTVKEPARPWFRPAVDTTASRALNITLAQLWLSVRAVAVGAGAPRNLAAGSLL